MKKRKVARRELVEEKEGIKRREGEEKKNCELEIRKERRKKRL